MRSKLRASASFFPPDQDGPVLSNGDPRFLKFFLLWRRADKRGILFFSWEAGIAQTATPDPFDPPISLAGKFRGIRIGLGESEVETLFMGPISSLRTKPSFPKRKRSRTKVIPISYSNSMGERSLIPLKRTTFGSSPPRPTLFFRGVSGRGSLKSGTPEPTPG